MLLPLANFCQLRTKGTLQNMKLELEEVRKSKKVRKKPPSATTCKFPVGKFKWIPFFFGGKLSKKGFFP